MSCPVQIAGAMDAMRLQDGTEADIRNSAFLFLGPRSCFAGILLQEATNYIAENAGSVGSFFPLGPAHTSSVPVPYEKGIREERWMKIVKTLEISWSADLASGLLFAHPGDTSPRIKGAYQRRRSIHMFGLVPVAELAERSLTISEGQYLPP